MDLPRAGHPPGVTMPDAALDPAGELEQLRNRLQEAEDTLQALRNGEVDAIVVGEDIYTLESAEAATNRFRSDVLAQMQDAVIATDLGDNLIYMNAAAERQYGLAASQVLGQPLHHLYRSVWLDSGDEAAAAKQRSEKGHWRGRLRHATHAGVKLLVECTLSSLLDSRGAVRGTLAVVRDVTKQAAAEVALGESRARLDFALASARIGEWDVHLASGVAVCSMRHDQCFGYSEPGAKWSFDIFLAHVHPDDRQCVEAHCQRAIESGGEMHFDTRVIWPDGSEHWIEVHGSTFNGQSPDARMLGTVSDITDRKRAEVELRDAGKRKDEFLATLAHELRSPLAPIRNSMHILRMSDEAQRREKAQLVVERQLEQMFHLVEDLLDVSRISQGKIELRKQRVGIDAVFRNAIDTSQPLIDAKRQQLDLRLPEQPVVVDVDLTRMTQVVSNLLSNAAKYTPDEGLITLGARCADGLVTISVQDSGIGIPADALPRVFDMFTQVDRPVDQSQGGLGIGLALVKRLVQLHGGTVEGHSAGENQGTTILVRLPAEATPAPAGPTPAPALVAPAGQAAVRVLVVDDNLDSADSLAAMLQLLGHDTAVANSGHQALELARSYRPQLMLLDIGLPDLNGHAVARRLRAQDWGRDILLAALTGWGQDSDRKLSLDAGFDQHLVKPLDLNVLLQLVEQAGQRQPGSS